MINSLILKELRNKYQGKYFKNDMYYIHFIRVSDYTSSVISTIAELFEIRDNSFIEDICWYISKAYMSEHPFTRISKNEFLKKVRKSNECDIKKVQEPVSG